MCAFVVVHFIFLLLTVVCLCCFVFFLLDFILRFYYPAGIPWYPGYFGL